MKIMNSQSLKNMHNQKFIYDLLFLTDYQGRIRTKDNNKNHELDFYKEGFRDNMFNPQGTFAKSRD